MSRFIMSAKETFSLHEVVRKAHSMVVWGVVALAKTYARSFYSCTLYDQLQDAADNIHETIREVQNTSVLRASFSRILDCL